MKLKFFRSQFFFNDEYSPAFILNESHHESKEISRFKCFQKNFLRKLLILLTLESLKKMKALHGVLLKIIGFLYMQTFWTLF